MFSSSLLRACRVRPEIARTHRASAALDCGANRSDRNFGQHLACLIPQFLFHCRTALWSNFSLPLFSPSRRSPWVWLKVMTCKDDRDGLQQPTANNGLQHVTPKSGVIASEALPWRERQWNTRDLSWRLISDIAAAGCAAGLVSPLIATIDR